VVEDDHTDDDGEREQHPPQPAPSGTGRWPPGRPGALPMGLLGAVGRWRGEAGQGRDRPAPPGGPHLRLPERGAPLLDRHGGEPQLRGDAGRRTGDGRQAGLGGGRQAGVGCGRARQGARHGREAGPDRGHVLRTDGRRLLEAAGGPPPAGGRAPGPGHELLDGDRLGAWVLAVVGSAGAPGDTAGPRAVPPRLFPHRCRHLLVVRVLVVLVPASTGHGPVAAHARGSCTIRGARGPSRRRAARRARRTQPNSGP
jgi:hypothetical protein